MTGAESRAETTTLPGHGRELRRIGLHLFALGSFAFTQPLLDLLGRYPAFLSAHAVDRWRLVGLIATLSVVVPGALALLGWLAARTRKPRGVRVALALLFLSFLLTALPLSKRLPVPGGWILALAVAGTATMLYLRSRSLRAFLALLVLLVVIFPARFVLRPEIGRLLVPPPPAEHESLPPAGETPIVVVIFDELPVSALMDAQSEIDVARFPNFATLARDARWFRNATSCHTGTELSVPALVSGLYPPSEEAPAPSYAEYPRTLFTWLGSSADMTVSESQTDLCPPSLCSRGEVPREGVLADLALVYLRMVAPPPWERFLPSLDSSWRGFWRPAVRAEARDELEEVTSFRGQIAAWRPPAGRPHLYYFHVNLPHRPWQLLPSTQRYNDPWRFIGTDTWPDDPWRATQGYHRFLLQTQAVDSLLGELTGRLRELGIYEEALLVVTSDHGVSFQPGIGLRGESGDGSALVRDVLPVPLFVKAPFATYGDIDDRLAEAVDILPTIADLLEVELPWSVDGRSLFAPSDRRAEHTALVRSLGHSDPALIARLTTAKVERLDWKLEHFADVEATGATALPAGAESLVGRQLEGLDLATDEVMAAVLSRPELYDAVDPAAPMVPSHIWGQVVPRHQGGVSSFPVLAVAVNGVVRAVTRATDENGKLEFSAIVPPAAFAPGANRVEVLRAIEADGTFELLRSPQPTANALFRERFDRSDETLLLIDQESGFSAVEAAGETRLTSTLVAGQRSLVIETATTDPAVLLPKFDSDAASALALAVDLTVPAATTLTVFHQTTTDPRFWWKHSARQGLAAGRQRVYLGLRHDALAGRLRLDPGQLPGRYVVHSIEVRRAEDAIEIRPVRLRP